MKLRKISRSNGIFNILLTLIGVILLVALGFSLNVLFTVQTEQSAQSDALPRDPNQPEVETRSPTSVVEQSSPTPADVTVQTDPIAGWETYCNEDQRYCIKFPSNWFFYPPSNDSLQSVAQFYSYERDKLPARGVQPTTGALKVEIVISSNPEFLTLDQYVDGIVSRIPKDTIEVSEESVAGVPATRVLYTRGSDSWTEIFVPRNDEVFRIIAGPATSSKISTFETMLQTVEFI